MKSLPILIIACILVTSMAYTPTANQAQCIIKIPFVDCAASDSDCVKSQVDQSKCISLNCLNTANGVEYGKCITETCKPSSPKILTYYSAVAVCTTAFSPNQILKFSPTTEQSSCISKIIYPKCLDTICQTELANRDKCVSEKCISITNGNEYGKCIAQTCISSNSIIQSNSQSFADCLMDATSTTKTTTTISSGAKKTAVISVIFSILSLYF